MQISHFNPLAVKPLFSGKPKTAITPTAVATGDQWVRFGQAEAPKPDAAAKAVLKGLVPKLDEAEDWALTNVRSEDYGSPLVGTDLSCKIGETTYTLRQYTETWAFPKDLEKTEYLITNGPEGEKTYPMEKETFAPFQEAFSKVARKKIEVNVLLDSLLPKLGEAGNWEMQYIRDKHGQMAVGSNLSCKIGDTTYTLREIFDRHGSGANIEPVGEYLVVKGPEGEKTYPTDYRTTFVPAWKAFMDAGRAKIAAQVIQDIMQHIDGFELKSASAHEKHGLYYFDLDGRKYSASWNNEKEEYTVYQEQLFSEEETKQHYEATVETYKEGNAKYPDRQIEIPSYEEYKIKNKYDTLTDFKIPKAQFEPLLKVLNAKAAKQLEAHYGIGENNNPRPLLENIARDLLSNPRDGKVHYRYHDERTHEVTFKDKDKNNLYIEVAKAPQIDRKTDEEIPGSFYYYVNIRTGGPSTMIGISKPEDIALVEKMLEIVQNLDTTHGGNWHLSIMDAMENLEKGSTIDEEVEKVMPKINGEPDLKGKPAGSLPVAALLLDELEEMLKKQ